MMEQSGERVTGTPNTIYDLSSILFHALEGGASYDQFVQDAEEAGDEELADFFRRVRDEDAMRADEAQSLLAERTAAIGGAMSGGAMLDEGVATGALPGTEPIEEDVPPPREGPVGMAPMEEELPPPRMEDVPPMTEERLRTEGTEPMAEELPPPGMEEGPPRTEEAPPPRTEERPLEEERLRTEGTEPGMAPMAEEFPPPRTEERPLREERLGTEGTMPSRTEEVSPREEAPLAGERERIQELGEEQREEDRGLIDRVKDALSPDEEEEQRRRSEGTDEPRRR